MANARSTGPSLLWTALALSLAWSMARGDAVQLDPIHTPSGYLARLLINEVPFPGERSYRSEQDSRAGMLGLLWVLHARIEHIPTAYSRQEVAGISSTNILEIIVAGGVKGQVDGFYKDKSGRFQTVPRVEARVNYLTTIANQGQPGRVASLLNHAQELARAYLQAGPAGPDIYAAIRRIGSVSVTGRAYSWMTDRHVYSPGGNFVSIPDGLRGSLAGNRFFSLRKTPR